MLNFDKNIDIGKKTSKNDKRIEDKHQRKFLYLILLSLGVNGPLHVNGF